MACCSCKKFVLISSKEKKRIVIFNHKKFVNKEIFRKQNIENTSVEDVTTKNLCYL